MWAVDMGTCLKTLPGTATIVVCGRGAPPPPPPPPPPLADTKLKHAKSFVFRRKSENIIALTNKNVQLVRSCSPSTPIKQVSVHKYVVFVPLAAAALSLLLCSAPPAQAGFLSGFSGIESVPGPQLPEMDFLTRWNEANQKRYAENDARFKESPLLKRLLEQSKLNKEKNKQEILDKYCIRGAEWGVGDCSTEGMSQEEKENFISMLKQKAGVE